RRAGHVRVLPSVRLACPQSGALTGRMDEPLDADPITQFQRWFAEAVAAGEAEPTAMTVATASVDGVPSARMVLLKEVDAHGFVFFTNYRSRKGRELG